MRGRKRNRAIKIDNVTIDELYSSSDDGSYIKNCFIKTRKNNKGEALFTLNREHIKIRLDGYAIIPKEDYIDQNKLEEFIIEKYPHILFEYKFEKGEKK